jgi:uncharacterized membrane protein
MGEALSFGWNTFKANVGFFIVLLIIVGIVQSIPSALQTASDNASVELLGAVLGIVIGMFVQIGTTRIALKFVDGQKAELSDLFSRYEVFFSLLIAGIIVGIAVMVGLILLIVPGIIIGIIFSMYGYVIVDRGLGPIDALKRSAAITDGARLALFGFAIVLMLLNIVGFLALVIGLFVTIPISMIAMAYVYRKLDSQTAVVPTSGVATT